MISLDQVSFCYPDSDFLLDVPQFTVSRATAVAVVGPSGSGKTTLLNLAAGILVPSSGTVRAGDVEVSALGEAERRDFRIRQLGLVFQEFELLEHLSVLDNILLPCRITPRVRPTQRYRRRASELAQRFGLGDKLPRSVRRLSQGERQRVAVCRALLLEPALLLCDEPTGNLDPANKQHVLDILLDYTRQAGATMLAATHDHGLLGQFDQTVDVSTFHATSGQRP